MGLEALGSLASATPYGAIANAAAQVLGTPTASTATQGPSAQGPVSVNVSGFGSKSSGYAQASTPQSLTQAEPDRGFAFPGSSVGDAGLPAWVLPAGIGVLLLVVVLATLKKR